MMWQDEGSGVGTLHGQRVNALVARATDWSARE
jgi:hypothetical protein